MTDFDFQREVSHLMPLLKPLACLFKEFGTFVGIVTLEDIMDEILKT